MRRTIAQARLVFEQEVLGRVTDYQRSEFEAMIREREKLAQREASSFVDSQLADAMSMRDDALRELTEVRDESDDLPREIGEARVAADDFALRLNELRARRENADTRLREADAVCASIDEAEADPVAWFDATLARSPQLMPDWPW